MSLPFNLRSRLRAQSSPPLSRSPARAGRLRPALRPPRARLGSTSTRSAPGRDGIVTSRWPCWPMPIWPLCVSTPSGGEDLDLAADLLPLTVPEVRRLIWRLVWARPPDPVRALAWSDWRRRHQQRAPILSALLPGRTGDDDTSSAQDDHIGPAEPELIKPGCSTTAECV